LTPWLGAAADFTCVTGLVAGGGQHRSSDVGHRAAVGNATRTRAEVPILRLVDQQNPSEGAWTSRCSVKTTTLRAVLSLSLSPPFLSPHTPAIRDPSAIHHHDREHRVERFSAIRASHSSSINSRPSSSASQKMSLLPTRITRESYSYARACAQGGRSKRFVMHTDVRISSAATAGRVIQIHCRVVARQSCPSERQAAQPPPPSLLGRSLPRPSPVVIPRRLFIYL
jgi:hypothetical protein